MICSVVGEVSALIHSNTWESSSSDFVKFLSSSFVCWKRILALKGVSAREEIFFVEKCLLSSGMSKLKLVLESFGVLEERDRPSALQCFFPALCCTSKLKSARVLSQRSTIPDGQSIVLMYFRALLSVRQRNLVPYWR